MKKILLMLVVAVASLTASAQVYVGGGLGFWHESENDVTTFRLAPSVGYELSEKWAIGAEVAYEFVKAGANVQTMEIAPYARWSYFNNKAVRLFVDMGFGVGVVKPEDVDGETSWNIGARPGIAVKLNDHFSLLAKVGFLGYDQGGAFGEAGWQKTKRFGFDLDGENLTFGIEYTF